MAKYLCKSVTPKAKRSYFGPKLLELITLSYIHFIENPQAKPSQHYSYMTESKIRNQQRNGMKKKGIMDWGILWTQCRHSSRKKESRFLWRSKNIMSVSCSYICVFILTTIHSTDPQILIMCTFFKPLPTAQIPTVSLHSSLTSFDHAQMAMPAMSNHYSFADDVWYLFDSDDNSVRGDLDSDKMEGQLGGHGSGCLPAFEAGDQKCAFLHSRLRDGHINKWVFTKVG